LRTAHSYQIGAGAMKLAKQIVHVSMRDVT